MPSGVGTGGSGGSMNRGPELLRPPSSRATEIFLGKTLRKIIKIVATKWRILRLKCTKFDFGWGSAPDPAGGAYSDPRPPSWISRQGGLGWGTGGKGKRKGREGEWSGGRGRTPKLMLNQGPSEPRYATVNARQWRGSVVNTGVRSVRSSTQTVSGASKN